MPTPIPLLRLTHGQVAWVLSQGSPPPAQTLDQLNYLRQRGVPFTVAELGQGRGNPLHYRFDHLCEIGIALFGLRRGFRPKDITDLVLKERILLRKYSRKAYSEQPAIVSGQQWVAGVENILPPLKREIFVLLHDRYSNTPGEIDIYEIGAGSEPISFGVENEKYPGNTLRTLLPLTRLILDLVAWSRRAPEIRAGRK